MQTPKALRMAEMTTYYGYEVTVVPCRVRLEEGRLTVFYMGTETQEYAYIGGEKGQGHYDLRCSEDGGRASLHAFPGSTFYEGFWTVNGDSGMWRVELDDE